MNWLTDLNWLAGPLLQVTLLVFMMRNDLRQMFPRFFSYILFQIIKSVCLFATVHYFPSNYFEAYWTGNTISVIFTLLVMDEILRRLFNLYGGFQVLGMTIFRWSCGLLLLLAILGAVSTGDAAGDKIVGVVFAFDRGIRLMQVGIVVLLLVLCRILKDSWKQPVFGVALGFGVFASVELILISFVSLYGSSHGVVISLVKSVAYNSVTLLWIGYSIRRPQPAVSMIIPGMAVAPAGIALDPDAGFMSRVEQAVDRVLSRSDWPRPVTNGPRVVGRKPTLEEGN